MPAFVDTESELLKLFEDITGVRFFLRHSIHITYSELLITPAKILLIPVTFLKLSLTVILTLSMEHFETGAVPNNVLITDNNLALAI